MKRWLETLVFTTLSLFLLLATSVMLIAMARKAGDEAGGVNGEAHVSIQAAAQTVVEMVAAWERPPQTTRAELSQLAPSDITPAQAPVMPKIDLSQGPRARLRMPVMQPTASETLQVDTNSATPTPQPQTPQSTLTETKPPKAASDQLPDVPQTDASEVPRPQLRTAILQPTAIEAPQIHTNPATPPPPKPRPKAKPQARPTTAQPETGVKSSRASASVAEERAAGSGGHNQAGAGKAKASTGNKGKQAKLKAIWGAKIRARIERRKRYPSRGSGKAKVTLRLTVARDGRLVNSGVSRSSGNPVFDQAALRAVSSAGRFPKMPKELPGTSFTFTLPMNFSR